MHPQNVLTVSSNCIEKIYEILCEKNIRGKFLLISDETVFNLYGKRVAEQIASLSASSVITELITDNTLSYAMTFTEKIISRGIDYIIGMGGGKALDVSKYAAYISKRPFISIPTAMASDGLASPIAVLMRADGKPMSLACCVPDVILIDVDVIMKSPVQLIKAGIGDAISNYMALLDWEVACKNKKDEMNGFAYLLSRSALGSLLNAKYTGLSAEFIRVLADSHVLSGIAMSFAGSSRPVSGSEHLFSHALDYYCENNNLHGIQVALGTIAMCKLINIEYNEVLAYMRRFDVDLNPARLGISEACFVRCMQEAPAMRKNRYTYLNTIDLNEGRLRALYTSLVNEL